MNSDDRVPKKPHLRRLVTFRQPLDAIATSPWSRAGASVGRVAGPAPGKGQQFHHVFVQFLKNMVLKWMMNLMETWFLVTLCPSVTCQMSTMSICDCIPWVMICVFLIVGIAFVPEDEDNSDRFKSSKTSHLAKLCLTASGVSVGFGELTLLMMFSFKRLWWVSSMGKTLFPDVSCNSSVL